MMMIAKAKKHTDVRVMQMSRTAYPMAGAAFALLHKLGFSSESCSGSSLERELFF